jgi:hypothetical protein
MAKEVIEIPVERKYADFEEEWYLFVKCLHKWRLVYPDFPFRGIWDRVEADL